MTRLRLWIKCALTRHNWHFEELLPGRGFGGASVRYVCQKCGASRIER